MFDIVVRNRIDTVDDVMFDIVVEHDVDTVVEHNVINASKEEQFKLFLILKRDLVQQLLWPD